MTRVYRRKIIIISSFALDFIHSRTKHGQRKAVCIMDFQLKYLFTLKAEFTYYQFSAKASNNEFQTQLNLKSFFLS